MNDTYAQIKNAIKNAARAAICGHVNPDGDAAASALAMRAALLRMGVDAVALLPSAPGDEYLFLPDFDKIVTADSSLTDDFDLIVCVDCADPSRMGAWKSLLEKKDRPVIVIDHHVTNQGFGSINLVVPEAAATGEVLTALFCALSIEITKEIALLLYTAICADTGGFAFSNTHASTLRTAAALVEHGAAPALVYEKLYASRRLSKTRLIARALSSIHASENGAVLTATLVRGDFADTGATSAESDGVIDFLRDVDTCCVCALIRDTKDGSKASFRCADGFDVSCVAARFGGGGHKNAAGCSFSVPAREAEQIVHEALIEHFRKVAGTVK